MFLDFDLSRFTPRYSLECRGVHARTSDEVAACLDKTRLEREVRIAPEGDLYVKLGKAFFTRVASRTARRLRAVDWWCDRFDQLVPRAREGGGEDGRAIGECRRAVQVLAFRPGERDEVLTLRGVHLLAVVDRVVSQARDQTHPLTAAETCEAIQQVIFQASLQELFPFSDKPPACAGDMVADEERNALSEVQGVIDALFRDRALLAGEPRSAAPSKRPRDPLQPRPGRLRDLKSDRSRRLLAVSVSASASARSTPAPSRSVITQLPGEVPDLHPWP